MKNLILRLQWCRLFGITCFFLLQVVLSENYHNAISGVNITTRHKTDDSISDCEVCKGFIEMLKIFKPHTNDKVILKFVKEDCNGKPSTKVCHRIKSQDDLNILWVSNVSSSKLCDYFLNDVCTSDLKVELPGSTKPANRSTTAPGNVKQRLKILHISDSLHELFLREKLSLSDKNSMILESVLQSIADNHKDVDFVFWTGDIPPSDVWNLSIPSNQHYFESTLESLKKYFKGVRVYPAVGNYHNFLFNSILTGRNASTYRLRDYLVREWSNIFPSENERDFRKIVKSILRGGYYSVSAKPGLRIISLNGNHCNRLYGLVHSQNRTEQLDWLVSELESAEKNREKVLILNSVSPGHPNCSRIWFNNYYEIINRYESTIVAQFYGSAPDNERVELYYDTKDNERPVSVAYCAQSLIGDKPTYSIYYLDGYYNNTTWEVLDVETYVLHGGENIWLKVHDARKDYNMQSLLPTDWNHLTRESNIFNDSTSLPVTSLLYFT